MTDRESVVSKALESKQMLQTMIGQKVVRMMIHDFDKFGRFLATVYQRGSCIGVDINVNDFMLNGGYAVKTNNRKSRDREDDDGKKPLRPGSHQDSRRKYEY